MQDILVAEIIIGMAIAAYIFLRGFSLMAQTKLIESRKLTFLIAFGFMLVGMGAFTMLIFIGDIRDVLQGAGILNSPPSLPR